MLAAVVKEDRADATLRGITDVVGSGTSSGLDVAVRRVKTGKISKSRACVQGVSRCFFLL